MGTLHPLEILKAKFFTNDFKIADWIDSVFDMDNIWVIKDTDDLVYAVDVSDVGKELISDTFTIRSTADKACDICNRESSWNLGLWLEEVAKEGEAIIWDFNTSNIRVDSAEWIVGSACKIALRKEVEKK